jgi:hypothetical protein
MDFNVAVSDAKQVGYYVLPKKYTGTPAEASIVDISDPRLMIEFDDPCERVAIYMDPVNVQHVTFDLLSNTLDIIKLFHILERIHMDTHTRAMAQSALGEHVKIYCTTIFGGATELGPDPISIAFKTRNWPVSGISPDAWREFLVDSMPIDDNWIVRMSKRIIDNRTKGIQDDYCNMDTDELSSPWDPSIKFDTMAEQGLEKYIDTILANNPSRFYLQVAEWLRKNIRTLNSSTQKDVLKFLVNVMRYKPATMRAVIPATQPQPTGVYDIESIADVLRGLQRTGMDDLFMTLMCSALCVSQYTKIIYKLDLVRHMTAIMNTRPVYTGLVKMAIAYVMYYLTRIEYIAHRHRSTLTDPFVLDMELIVELPVFADCDITPWMPMAIKYPKYNIPMHVSGVRRPVPVADIPTRLNTTMVADGYALDITKDIPWGDLSLVLTGSRYTGACWVGPRELTYPSLREYIVEYIGTSTRAIGDMCAAYKAIKHAPMLILPEIDGWEQVDGALDDSPALRAILAAAEAMKKPDSVFNRPTDIDIAFIGEADKLNTTARKLIDVLRRYGTAFGIKNERPYSYTWTIVSEALRFTIDLYCPKTSAIGMLAGYMTSYPRAYFDGARHIGTADYVCARMSGVNHRYAATMYDPISVMMKCLYREDISMIVNDREKELLEKWFAKFMPRVQRINFGNVSMDHPFFARANDPYEKKYDTVERPWVYPSINYPYSKMVIGIWDYINGRMYMPSLSVIERYLEGVTSGKDAQQTLSFRLPSPR